MLRMTTQLLHIPGYIETIGGKYHKKYKLTMLL